MQVTRENTIIQIGINEATQPMSEWKIPREWSLLDIGSQLLLRHPTITGACQITRGGIGTLIVGMSDDGEHSWMSRPFQFYVSVEDRPIGGFNFPPCKYLGIYYNDEGFSISYEEVSKVLRVIPAESLAAVTDSIDVLRKELDSIESRIKGDLEEIVRRIPAGTSTLAIRRTSTCLQIGINETFQPMHEWKVPFTHRVLRQERQILVFHPTQYSSCALRVEEAPVEQSLVTYHDLGWLSKPFTLFFGCEDQDIGRREFPPCEWLAIVADEGFAIYYQTKDRILERLSLSLTVAEQQLVDVRKIIGELNG